MTSYTPANKSDKQKSSAETLGSEVCQYLRPRDVKLDLAVRCVYYLSARDWELLKKRMPGLPHPGGMSGVSGVAVSYPETLDGQEHIAIRPLQRFYFRDTVDGSGERVDLDDGMRWIRRPGLPSVPWILETVRTSATAEETLVVEAPIKALALLSHGFNAIGLAGAEAGGLDPKNSNQLHAEMLRVDWRGRPVTLLFDSNIATKVGVARGAARLAKALREAGAIVSVAFLPSLVEADITGEMALNGAKAGDVGPDDYLFAFGKEALKKVLAAAVPSDPIERVKGKTDEETAAILREPYFQASLKYAEPAARDLVTKEIKKLGLSKTTLTRALETFDQAVSKSSAKKRDSGTHLEIGDDAELAKVVLSQLTGGKSEDLIYTDNHFWRYEETKGTWRLVEDSEIISMIASYSQTPVGPDMHPLAISGGKARGTLDLLKANVAKKEFFASAPLGVAFKNGFLKIDLGTKSGERIPHSRDNRTKFSYDFDLDLSKESLVYSKYRAFVNRLCAGKSEDEYKATLDCLLGFLGASITGVATKFRRAIYMKGEQGSGKSTLLEIHKNVMPTGSVCTVMPGQFEERFYRIRLHGALLNAVDDIPTTEMRNSGVYKSAIVGKQINAEEKGEPVITFEPRAGHLGAFNDWPMLSDTSDAFKVRTIVLRFDSVIRGSSEENVVLAEQIVATEKPIIINAAINALLDAIKNNAYTIPESSFALVDEWCKTTGSTAPWETWRDEQMTKLTPTEMAEEANWTQAMPLYERYKLWAIATTHKPMSMTTFGNRMREWLGFTPDEGTKTPYSRRVGKYYPVKWSEMVVTQTTLKTQVEDALYDALNT